MLRRSRRSVIQFRTKFGRNRKQSCGFQFNDPKIFFHRQVQVETPLRLNDFPGANITRRPRNRAADLGIVESGGKIERVREKGIAQQHAQGIAPASVQGWLAATALRFIHDVVVHQSGQMN